MSGGLDTDDTCGKITLISDKKDKKFVVERKHALISNLIKTSLESDKTASQISLEVQTDTLTKVIAYMDHHQGVDPPVLKKPLRSKKMSDVCKDKFDAEFIDNVGENRQDLFDLILAANYLDIPSLLHLSSAKVASLIKGQPLENIQSILSKGGKRAKSGAVVDPKQA